MHSPLVAELPNWLGNTWVGGLFFQESAIPHCKRVPSTPQFWGFPSIYAYTLCRRTTKFDLVTRGGSVYLEVSQASHPKRAEFHGSPILGVLLHLCIHPLTQNDQIQHGNTYGEGRVFRCCIWTNALRGLSVTAEFVVYIGNWTNSFQSQQFSDLCIYYTRDAIHKCGICRRNMSVSLSVCHTPAFCLNG